MMISDPHPHSWRVYPRVSVLVSAIYKVLSKILVDFAAVEMSSITNVREQVQVSVVQLAMSGLEL